MFLKNALSYLEGAYFGFFSFEDFERVTRNIQNSILILIYWIVDNGLAGSSEFIIRKSFWGTYFHGTF